MAFMRNLVCGFQTHFRSRLILFWPSNFWAYAARRTTPRSIHRLTFNSNDTWLSEIVDLTTLKLFGLRSRSSIKDPPPEVIDSGFAVKISPRFPVSPNDLQSRQQPTFTDSLALYTFFSGFWMTTWHDHWKTRDSASLFSLAHVFPSPVQLSTVEPL